MDFDQLLLRAFGSADLSTVPQERLLAGIDSLRSQLDGDDDDERFAIWCLLYMLGAAPDAEDVFDDPEDQAAAQDFMTSIDQDEQD